MATTMRAVQYVRVSRSDQKPGMQADETAEMIRRRGWKLSDTYTDHGISGARDRRPELDRLLDDARHGRFDVLVVYKADRLFRSLRHMVNTLDELAALNVSFVSCTEPFDTATPSGRLLLNVISAMGSFERDLLIERTKSGIAAARRRGAKVGRPRAHVDVDLALELRAAGKSIREIGVALGVGAATVSRALAASKSESVAAE
jgi:DNA invertase Pin-like site-specific DNA recombinase